MASSPSPSSLDSVGTSPLGSFSDPNEHPLLARDLGLGPLVGYGDSGVFNGMNSTNFSSCSSMMHNSALSLYLNGLGSSGNLDSGSALKVFYFFPSSPNTKPIGESDVIEYENAFILHDNNILWIGGVENKSCVLSLFFFLVSPLL
jgi:hypothetical protein